MLTSVQVAQLNQVVSEFATNPLPIGDRDFGRQIDLGNDIEGVTFGPEGNIIGLIFDQDVFADRFGGDFGADPMNFGMPFTPAELFNLVVVSFEFPADDYNLPSGNRLLGGGDARGLLIMNVDFNGDNSADATVVGHNPDGGPQTGDTISYGNQAGNSESGSMYVNNDGAWIPYDDSDIDNDGTNNSADPDMDGDGIPNNQDVDDDNDGFQDTYDDAPSNPYQGGGYGEGGDGTSDLGNDFDGDGTWDGDDRDMDGDGTSNSEDDDVDGDEIPNDQDEDDDNDGSPDDEDDDDDNDPNTDGIICVECGFGGGSGDGSGDGGVAGGGGGGGGGNDDDDDKGDNGGDGDDDDGDGGGDDDCNSADGEDDDCGNTSEIFMFGNLANVLPNVNEFQYMNYTIPFETLSQLGQGMRINVNPGASIRVPVSQPSVTTPVQPNILNSAVQQPNINMRTPVNPVQGGGASMRINAPGGQIRLPVTGR